MTTIFYSVFIVILAFPLIVNVLLPLLMLVGWLLFQPIKTFLPKEFDTDTYISVREHSTKARAEKRDDRRISVDGIIAEVADGNGVYEGLVTNVSRAGICVQNLPERLARPASRLSVIIRNKTDEYCFFLNPVWNERQKEAGRSMGGRLENVPSNWRAFVHSY